MVQSSIPILEDFILRAHKRNATATEASTANTTATMTTDVVMREYDFTELGGDDIMGVIASS